MGSSAKENSDTKAKWDSRYRTLQVGGIQPARVLLENTHLLPQKGQALDLACGMGANAVLLAQIGLEVTAWDISSIATKKLQSYADSLELAVNAEPRDIVANPPLPRSFDVIVVSRFLERKIISSLIDSLRPAGILFYQTFIQDSPVGGGPGNPLFRLADNELLALFAPLRLLVYREEGGVGDVSKGFRNEAMFIGLRV